MQRVVEGMEEECATHHDGQRNATKGKGRVQRARAACEGVVCDGII